MAELSNDQSICIQESAVGSTIVSGNHNTIYIVQRTQDQQRELTIAERALEIVQNPYKGLAAFEESDANRYFGRELQVKRLWQRFQNLYEQSEKKDVIPRFLPILGPSGCGKSSLARAGLIPEMARCPLVGTEQLRVVVFVPGSRPLEALAGVLVKAAITNDPLPVGKARELEGILGEINEAGEYDGLRRIANFIPGIREIPLVILVDQFEEIYSLCENPESRHAFINTLLCATNDPNGNVSVVITLRSDFLPETQHHQELNQVICSDQSVIVPAMTKEELRLAIAEPAKQANHPFDESIIDLLVNDTEGREGALPLLQFALSRIWEGLNEDKPPAKTYREMDGIGGALADKAQEIYDKLTHQEKDIARRVFINLVQLGEGTRDTRRRVFLESLITKSDSLDNVNHVVQKFSSKVSRLITLSSWERDRLIEVTHESLFEHWQQLIEWLNSSREDIRFNRRLSTASAHWNQKGRPEGLLWRSPDLEQLEDYQKRAFKDIGIIEDEFFIASIEARNLAKRKAQIRLYGTIIFSAIFAAIIIFAQQQFSRLRFQKQLFDILAGSSEPDLVKVLPRLVQIGEQQLDGDEIAKAIETYKLTLKAADGFMNSVSEDVYIRYVRDAQKKADIKLSRIIKEQFIDQELKVDLASYKIGSIDESFNDVSRFENQYSIGGLRTTYRILMRKPGLGLDENNNGRLDPAEIVYLPCDILREIEKLWRHYTDDKCGFYGEDFYENLNCNALEKDTLAVQIFHPEDSSVKAIENHLESCQLVGEER